MDRDNSITEVWTLYERGKSYNNRLTPNQYRMVNANTEFYAGNQWIHLQETPAMQKLPKPVFNIIKRITQLFVASLTVNKAVINYEPLSYYDGENLNDPDTNASVYANAEVRNLMEKFGMDFRIREALVDGAISGDYCAHFWYDPEALPYGGAYGPYRGELRMELVDGLNVMFGNPNVDDAQQQPYILIIGRDTVENLQAEAKRHHRGKGDSALTVDSIVPDAEYQEQQGVGGKTEIEPDDRNGKCLYAIMYRKISHEEDVIDPATGIPMQEVITDKNGDPVPVKDENGNPMLDFSGAPIYKTKTMRRTVTSVHVTKATRTVTIYEDIDTGLTLYPIAWGNWEKQKNQYHGRALVTGIIPNQIYINTMFAMVMRHLQLTAFGKTVYNADYIRQWSNEVGEAIAVRGLPPGANISQVAHSIQPADMSNQIILTIDKALQYTRECLGATDVQMGNAKPENTSALMVMQSAAEVPLENIRSGLYEWLEQIGAILLDMMGTYYGKRPLVRDMEMSEIVTDPATGEPMIDPMTGMMVQEEVTRRVLVEFDFSQFKNLWLNVGVDAGAGTYFSEVAMVQTLDNLRMDGTLDIIDYLERVPDRLIPRKKDLISKLRTAAARSAAAPTMALDPSQMSAQQTGAMGAAVAAGVMPASGGPSPSPMSRPNADMIATPSATRAKDPTPIVGGELSKDKLIGSMPQGTQSRFNDLPAPARRALLQQERMRNG